MPYAIRYVINNGADQPAHRRTPISAFDVGCLDSIIHIFAKSKILRLELVSVAEQAGLCLTWSQTLKTGFLMTWLIIGTPPYTSVLSLVSKQKIRYILIFLKLYSLFWMNGVSYVCFLQTL